MDPKVWSFLLVVVAVCLVLWAVLKVLAKVVADRNTRRIITKGMSGDETNERPSTAKGHDAEKKD